MRSLLLTTMALAVLAACGKKDNTAPEPSSAPKTSSSAPAANTGSNADAANALRIAQDKVVNPDLSVPKDNFTAVERTPGDQWATYVAVAFDERVIDDKELLNLFSPRYYNEPDAFKKQEIATSDLGPIKERLAAYRKQRYYSIPFGANDPGVINLLIQFAGPYDFDKKSFPLTGACGSGGVSYGNRQNILLQLGDSAALCQLSVADIEMAKRIEALRASNKANLRGTIYFFVQKVEGGNRVQAMPTDIVYELWDQPSYLPGGSRVATFEQKR